jgi:hypothetical protein
VCDGGHQLGVQERAEVEARSYRDSSVTIGENVTGWTSGRNKYRDPGIGESKRSSSHVGALGCQRARVWADQTVPVSAYTWPEEAPKQLLLSAS